MPTVLVYLTLTVPRIMLFEAFLSFLGLGVERPQVSWGVLAREGFGAITAIYYLEQLGKLQPDQRLMIVGASGVPRLTSSTFTSPR